MKVLANYSLQLIVFIKKVFIQYFIRSVFQLNYNDIPNCISYLRIYDDVMHSLSVSLINLSINMP